MLNIATIGPSLYVVELLGSKKWLHIPHISLLELTIFGATLSAIDPVSVSENDLPQFSVCFLFCFSASEIYTFTTTPLYPNCTFLFFEGCLDHQLMMTWIICTTLPVIASTTLLHFYQNHKRSASINRQLTYMSLVFLELTFYKPLIHPKTSR